MPLPCFADATDFYQSFIFDSKLAVFGQSCKVPEVCRQSNKDTLFGKRNVPIASGCSRRCGNICSAVQSFNVMTTSALSAKR